MRFFPSFPRILRVRQRGTFFFFFGGSLLFFVQKEKQGLEGGGVETYYELERRSIFNTEGSFGQA